MVQDVQGKESFSQDTVQWLFSVSSFQLLSQTMHHMPQHGSMSFSNVCVLTWCSDR